MTLGWPWPILQHRKNVKTVLFQKLLQPVTWMLIDADIHLNLCWRSRAFHDLCPRSFICEIKISFSQKPLGHFELDFVRRLAGTRKWKFLYMMLVTWQRWMPSPYMIKTHQKSSFPELVDWFPRNLVCSIVDSCVSIDGQGHFLTLAQGHVHMNIKKCFS